MNLLKNCEMWLRYLNRHYHCLHPILVTWLWLFWAKKLGKYYVKFRFSKKATKFETISHLIWRLVSKLQIKWGIVLNFVAFLENLNFHRHANCILGDYQYRFLWSNGIQLKVAICQKVWSGPKKYFKSLFWAENLNKLSTVWVANSNSLIWIVIWNISLSKLSDK